MRRRTGPDSRRSASRSSRTPGRAAATGPWSASPARGAWPGRARPRPPLRFPLMRAGRALRQLPVEAEQVLEVVVAPLRGRAGPRDFQAAGDGVTARALPEGAPPAEALLLEAGP